MIPYGIDKMEDLTSEKVTQLLREAEKPTMPLFLINWVFGIGIIEYPFGSPQRLVSLIHTSIIMTIYCLMASDAAASVMMESIELDASQMIIRIVFLSQIFLTIGSTLLGLRRSKFIHVILTNVVVSDHLLQTIGIKKNYEFIFKLQLKKILKFFFLILGFVLVNSIYLLTQFRTNNSKFVTLFVMNYPVIIMFIVDSTFLNFIDYMRIKLKKLNDMLKSLSSTSFDCPQHTKIINIFKKPYQLRAFTVWDAVTADKSSIIQTAKIAHAEIIKGCKLCDEAFALQILLSISVAVGVITASLYQGYVIIYLDNKPLSDTILVVLGIAIWIVYYASKIFLFAYCCCSTAAESVRTGDVISEYYDDAFITEEARNEIRDFNLQLIKNSLKFRAYGFVSLDFTLLQGIIAAVTTYLMVMVQLGDKFRNKRDT